MESLIFLLQSGCVVSPILDYGVARIGPAASVMYLLTITELLSDEKYDSFDWLDIPGLASFKNFKICNK
jgi:hypothetical protein